MTRVEYMKYLNEAENLPIYLLELRCWYNERYQ